MRILEGQEPSKFGELGQPSLEVLSNLQRVGPGNLRLETKHERCRTLLVQPRPVAVLEQDLNVLNKVEVDP